MPGNFPESFVPVVSLGSGEQEPGPAGFLEGRWPILVKVLQCGASCFLCCLLFVHFSFVASGFSCWGFSCVFFV